MQLDEHQLTAAGAVFFEVYNMHDLFQLCQLLHDLLKHHMVALHDDRHAGNLRISRGRNGQRVDVVAAAAKQAGYAGQNTGVVLYGDRKDILFHNFSFLIPLQDRQPCRLPGSSAGRARPCRSVHRSAQDRFASPLPAARRAARRYWKHGSRVRRRRRPA